MSIDKSLKSKGLLARHRNVLTRAERVEYLKEAGDWSDDASPFGLPKVVHRKANVGKKEKKKDVDTAQEGDTPSTDTDEEKT